ncbi:MAG: four helix bundle protein [Candidatus Marinimicrobia bacterium]|nr:four helix bundle protein [Candidatus Neomarinimicrobiota bacterium]MCF7922300.1 four helix bundle protein [Candidatus Neomarinimicrobiota bacterium]
MSKVTQFEDLRIWQEARELVGLIYTSIDNHAFASKDWGFRNQIQTAVISIMNNIPEGFERSSDKDLARFLDMA